MSDEIGKLTPRDAYETGYRNGESNLLADVATLCDQLDIEIADGQSEFDAIRTEIARLRQIEAREEDRRQDWLEKT